MATKRKTRSKKVLPVSVVAKPPVKKPINYVFIAQVAVVVLVGLLAFFMAKKYKGYFIAATVNKTSISRLELERKLNQRYAKTTLDELISSALLKDLAKQNNVTTSTEDISKERKTIEDRLGGAEALKSSLVQYGMTEDEFVSRLETVIVERKLSEKLFKIDITDAEVEKYYTDNKPSFGSQKLNEVSGQIKDSLLQQRQQQEFGTWFTDQKTKAQIKSYI